MEKRWIFKTLPDKHLIDRLREEINVNQNLATLLAQRGIQSFLEAKAFFRPKLEDLHDPYLMKDMHKAIERIDKAIQKQEKILIYGDYDVDGTTSVALVYGFLQEYHPYIDFYIPDRYKEGYGISKQSIDWSKEQGITLIIALDCGIKSIQMIDYAKELGIDYIICDHHLPGSEVPKAVAVLDAKQNDCPYPYKELSGCGVGFKLLQAFCIKHQISQETKLFPFLDLLVVSISADIVHMTGENRLMSFYGLDKLNDSPRTGLKALIDIAGFQEGKPLNIRNVVFGLAPRINAAGRIEHAKQAVNLLLSNDKADADHWADLVNKNNLTRRGLDSSITEEALEMIEEMGLKNNKSTVLFSPKWHKGVIGIVASRCIETYHRPTVILMEENGKVSGSARSVAGFDLYTALEHCADVLEQFGGHTHAAGMTMKLENIEKFQAKFEEVVSSMILEEQLIPSIDIDLKLNFDDIHQKMYNILKLFAPHGPYNMTPTFVSEHIIVENPQVLKEQHLKFKARQKNSTNTFDVIGFYMAQYYPLLKEKDDISICYTIEENTFMDRTTLQLQLRDIK